MKLFPQWALLLLLVWPSAAGAFLFSYGSSGSATGAHIQYIEQLVKEFRLDHPDVVIDVRGATSYVAPVVESLMYEGSSGVPDLAVVGLPESPMLLEKNRLNPLSTYLNGDDVAAIRKSLRTELDVQYYGPKSASRDYFLPFNRSNLVLYLNTNLLDVGKKSRLTWAELIALLEKKRAALPGLRSRLKVTLPLDDWNFEPMLVSVRGGPTIEHDQVHLNDSATREVVAMLVKLKRSGLLDLVLTQGRAYLDFIQGTTAGALVSMSSYTSVVENAKFLFRILMPPPLKKNIVVIGGGDLLFPKNSAVKMSAKIVKDVRTFVRWYYLERGAALWARLVGYHPVTTSALSNPLFREYVSFRPLDRNVLLNTAHVERQTFYRVDRYCNVVEIRKMLQNGMKEIIDANGSEQVMARVQAELTAFVRKPCP